MKKNTSHGFTLIETMVAVSILALSVAGPLFVASRVLVATEISRDQLTASYLAQEGIEFVRAARDNAYLAIYNSTSPRGTNPNLTSLAWSDFLTGPISGCLPPNGCNPASQLGLTTVISPSFIRSIQATPATATLPNIDEKITSSVAWDFHGTHYMVTITDHLTPWQ